MNPNLYDIMAMQQQEQIPLMLRGVPAAQVQAPPKAPQDVSMIRMNNPNAAQVTPAKEAKPSLMDLFRQRSQEGNEAQKDAIRKIEEQMTASQGAPGQTDWSALAALTDSWTGSNFSKMYQKPETEQERAQKLLNMQAQLLGAKDKITDNDLNMLKTEIQSERDDQKMRHELTLEELKSRALNNQLQQMSQGPKITESERKAALFGSRAADANKYLEDLQATGLDATSPFSALQQSKFFPEGYKTQGNKQLEQAQRNFLTAVLRKESGAVIGTDEMKSGGLQYFPSWGDDAQTLALKAQNRARAIEGLNAEGARAAQGFQATPELYKTPPKAPSSSDIEAELKRRGLR